MFNPNYAAQFPEWICRRIADQGPAVAARVLFDESNRILISDPTGSAFLANYSIFVLAAARAFEAATGHQKMSGRTTIAKLRSVVAVADAP